MESSEKLIKDSADSYNLTGCRTAAFLAGNAGMFKMSVVMLSASIAVRSDPSAETAVACVFNVDAEMRLITSSVSDGRSV